MTEKPTDDELRHLAQGYNLVVGTDVVEPVPALVQAMAKELLAARKHAEFCIHCECRFCQERE